MAKKKQLYYVAKWAQAGHPSIANVSFYATGDYRASQKADRIARDLGVTKTPRTIQREGQVVQCLTRGVSRED